MITVLFASHTAELKGAERFLLDTLRAIDRTRFAPLLLVPRPGPLAEAARAAGVQAFVVRSRWSLAGAGRTWRQPLAGFVNVPAARRIASLARRVGADVVFSNSAANFTAARAARRAGLPHVWFVHEALDGPAPMLRSLYGPRRLAVFIVRRSAVVLVASRTAAAAFEGAGPVRVVYNGITPGAVRPSRAAARRALGGDASETWIGMVGTIFPGKGQREGLRAAAIVAKRHPSLRVKIAGEAGDAAYDREVRALAESPELRGRVEFLGRREDMPDVFASLDCLLVASTVDSFGRAPLEAMAAGIPVVAAPCGGLPELVRDGETGFLAASARPEDLASAVEAALSDPARTARIARAARERVEREFTLAAQVAAIERALEDAVGH